MNLEIVASAVISGVTWNEVHMIGPRGGIVRRHLIKRQVEARLEGRDQKRDQKPRGRNQVKLWRADQSVRGKGTIQACVAFPPDELAWLDRMAQRCQTSRSHFIRQAVKHFGEKIFPDGKIPRR